VKKQVSQHKHVPSDIIETTDDMLLPHMRSVRDPSKIERTIVEGFEHEQGTTFPTEPYDGQKFTHTGWNMEFRWDETNNWWVATDYDGTKETSVTVNAAGTSITIQNNTTGITISANTTGISIQNSATGITINTGTTSISINKNTSDITIIDHATGLTIIVNSTGVTVQDGDADTSVVSDNSNVTAQSTYLDWDYVGIYTGTLSVSYGSTSSVDIVTLPNNVEIIAECGIGLQTAAPDVIEACHFLFKFYRLGTERYAIGAPMKEWTEKASGFYPWRGLLNDYTGSSSNKIRLTVENKKTSGTLYIQYRVRVQSRAAHSHTMNDPNHPHGTTDPGHPHGTNDPNHLHTPSDPDHDHNTQEPDGGQGHPHTPTDPGHPHNKTDPGHPHGVTDPEHEHQQTKTDDPP